MMLAMSVGAGEGAMESFSPGVYIIHFDYCSCIELHFH